MGNRKSTKYSGEEIEEIRGEYLNTTINLKELVKKYNLSIPVKDSFRGLKSKFPKLTDRTKEEWDAIIEYYRNNDVSHEEMKELFNLTTHQCNFYLSFTKKEKKYHIYDRYTEEEWEVIIDHYMMGDMTYLKMKGIYNISDTEMNKRFKGLKDIVINVGDTNNKLTIIDINLPSVLRGKQYRRMVRVRCECGTEFDINYNDFKVSKIKSCGCLLYKSLGNTFYSQSNTPGGKRTYGSYSSMRGRCLNPNHHNYPYYGGRGIKICDRWLEGYKNFKEDMGERPEGTTLDRIDANGNYEPGNCRWATNYVQSINQRRYSHLPQYTDDEWVDIKKEYIENGLTYDDISIKYSISVSQLMKRFGGLKKIEDKKLWETINDYQREHNLTFKELSNMFGVNISDVYRKIIRYDNPIV